MDCYDELGNHYQLPVYCLSTPVNIVKKTDRKVSQSQLPHKLQPVSSDDPLVYHIIIVSLLYHQKKIDYVLDGYCLVLLNKTLLLQLFSFQSCHFS